MLEKLPKNASFLVILAEMVQSVISSSPSFEGVGCLRDVVGIRGKLKEDSKFRCQKDRKQT